MSYFPQPYPLYDQPDEFKHEFDHERSRSIALKHFAWFVSNVPNRISVLQGYFAYEPSVNVEANLTKLGNMTVSCLKFPWSSEEAIPLVLSKGNAVTTIDQGRSLSPRGRSLAIDMGIFLAQAFLESDLGLQWEFISKPKNDLYFQAAVLRCGTDIYDPKQSSIAKLSTALRRGNNEGAWLDMYLYFTNVCRNIQSK